MSNQAFVARLWDSNTLFTALLELTYRCNLRCFYCYNDVDLRGVPLQLQQYLALLDELQEMGALNLILSGGEPLAHPDFFEIGAHARRRGFLVKIKSNGHALRDHMLQRIKDEIDPFMVEVSLHGACAATHDRQTRVAGSFDRLIQNLKDAGRTGIRLKLNGTITRWNENEMEEMYRLADSLGLELQVNPDVTPRDNGDPEPLEISPSRAAIERLFEIQQRRSSRVQVALPTRASVLIETPPVPAESSRQCGAGASSIAVDPYGNVYPCVQWRRPLGNLHERSIREIWSGSPQLDQVRELNSAVKKMVTQQGNAGRAMSYCAGLAESYSGDPLRIYPVAQMRKERFVSVSDKKPGD